ncbi:MAG: 3-keto-5-aminohexanoate cleavage protein [Chloroflexi bacterium]|nr:3-keto-5-aminohexanoate cleavage protein [Chloroflexota bacterium]
MQKLIIEAAINEATSKDLNPNIPYGPEEIARDAVECAKAGASIIHFHARDPQSGDQRWIDADLYAESYRLIQRECAAILYPTYSASLPMKERHSHVAALGRDKSVRFEMATIDLGAVNMASFDPKTKQWGRDFVYNNPHSEVMEFFRMAKDLDISYNLGIREPGHLRHALAYYEMGILREPLNIKFFFTDKHPYGLPPTVRGLQAYLEMLPPGLPHAWFIQSYGETHALMEALAITMGGHVRTGIGDNARMDGKAVTSAKQVERFATISRKFGREVATPAEARMMLGIPG